MMPRVGFKKTWAAGSFDKAALQTLFGHLKDYVTAAGFNVLAENADGIDFIRMGTPAGSAGDDIPHWAFSFQEDGADGQIRAYSVYGNDYLHFNAKTNSSTLINTAWIAAPAPEISFWFAADGAAGWWWLHGADTDPYSSTGLTARAGCVGASSRRYPADMHQGVCARYGVWEFGGYWLPPYAHYLSGELDAYETATWSPFGEGRYFCAKRDPASSMPRMAVPQFPNRDNSIGACILGEFNEVLILTDGYAQEEIVVPGWIAMTGGDSDPPYAVPAPEGFDEL